MLSPFNITPFIIIIPLDYKKLNSYIKVSTEYEYWVSGKERSRRQDFRVDEKDNITFIEFQNDNKCNPPIHDRSIQYFGLGIGQQIGGISNQIWMLAKPAEDLLHGQPITCYKLLDERKGFAHPNKSYIMFVDVHKLANEYEGLEVQEMSKFLLNGKAIPEHNERAIAIAKIINNSFIDLKNDREVLKAMTLKEDLERQAEERERLGREEGEKIGMIRILMEEMGLNAKSIANRLGMEEKEVDRIAEILNN